MSRSQGAANGGWQGGQRPAAGETDPRTGGRPAQRPQAPQQAPQYAPPAQQNAGYPAAGLRRTAGAGSVLQRAAADLSLSAAGPGAPVRAPASSGRGADQSSGAEQPRQRAQRANARFRQLPAHPAPRLRATGASVTAATAAPAAHASSAVAATGRLARRPGPIRAAGGYRQTAPQPQYRPACPPGRPKLRPVAGARQPCARSLWA